MSRDFSNVPLQNYRGIIPASQALFGGGHAVPLLFNWNQYSLNLSATYNAGVTVNLQAGNPAPLINNLRSLFIDNAGSQSTIYVLFPDTGYSIGQESLTAGWYPVFTNVKTFNVYVAGVDTTNNVKIFPCDLLIPPFVTTIA
jgi:hypothetical protein